MTSTELTWVYLQELISGIKAKDHVELYTDGGCNPNPGVGGWGAVFRHDGKSAVCRGGAILTTNNRMEMTAVAKSLSLLPEGCKVDIYTDSQYVCKGITSWMYGWSRNGWVNRQGTPVVNKDIWLNLFSEARRLKLTMHWVKGHNSHRENEICDALATSSIHELNEEIRLSKLNKLTPLKKPSKVRARRKRVNSRRV